MNPLLVETIANIATFLEFSEESDIRLEVAVKQLEEIGFRLQQLPPRDKEEFNLLIRQLAATCRNEQEREFLERFPIDFGLE
jgi:hypothetical protein